MVALIGGGGFLRDGFPGGVVGVGFEAGVDKGEAHAAVVNVGVGAAVAFPWLVGLVGADVFFELAVESGVGVVEGFAVAAGDGGFVEQPLRDIAEEAIVGADLATPVSAVGLVLEEDGDFFRIFLTPLERAFGSGDHDT